MVVEGRWDMAVVSALCETTLEMSGVTFESDGLNIELRFIRREILNQLAARLRLVTCSEVPRPRFRAFSFLRH
jgi:hypothetical protein